MDLPYDLKPCFLYLSVFSLDEYEEIRRRRLVRRWMAEGYSRGKHWKTAEEVAEKQFEDLLKRNMIRPSNAEISKISNSWKTNVFDIKNINADLSRKHSAEENLVLVLDKDEQCSLQHKSKMRHLVLGEGWSRERKMSTALESILELSHIRSLTVLGEFKSFFISKNMRLLRVLDLEDSYGLRDRDLYRIGKLRHLRYLSLRGSRGIFHLPDSLGNLSNLETKMPPTIVKLQKLKYIHAGIISCDEDESSIIVPEALPYYCSVVSKVCFRKETIYEETEELDTKLLVPLLCLMVTVWLRRLDPCGVKAPRGIGKLRALQTLGVVNVARGKNVLKEIEKLAQLSKLGITGINRNNGKKLGSAISSCSQLQTLSMRAEGKDGLVGCLDDISPPEDLQSLKLYGNLGKLPGWIGELQSLVKLTLRSTLLEQDDVQVLGKLPNLTSSSVGKVI